MSTTKLIITSHYNIYSRGYKFSYNGSWFVRYSKGDYTIPHDHDLSWMSWVYFINCPKGSSPLVLTDSSKRIISSFKNKPTEHLDIQWGVIKAGCFR